MDNIKNAGTMFDLTLTLLGSDPPVWRRLLAPRNASLEDLHEAIQSVTGWLDYHLHEFTAGEHRFGRPDYVDDDGADWMGSPLEDARGERLQSLWSRGIREVKYTYDFGDGWVWNIELAGEIAGQEHEARFRCTDGAGGPPPEDAGGIDGFEELCDILADPDHPEHEDMLQWVPPGFDRGSFQAAGTDWILAHRDESSERDHLLGWLGAMPEHLTMTAPYYLELWWRLQKPDLTTPERADQVARALIEEYSRRPMRNRDDLTFGRFTDLNLCMTGRQRDPLQLNTDLAGEELDTVPYLLSAQTMLQMFQEMGPQRTGVRRRLPQRFRDIFIGRVISEAERAGRVPPNVRTWFSRNRLNPDQTRENLQDAGLVRLYRQAYRLTPTGEQLLEAHRRGELLDRLFVGFFGAEPDYDHVDSWLTVFLCSYGYLLYRWSRLATEWREPAQLLEELAPYHLKGSMLRQLGCEDAPESFEIMFLWQLELFGLAESRRRPGPGSESSPRRYRPTPLARRFLQFQFAT